MNNELETLIDKRELEEICVRLGEQISRDYAECEKLIILTVLKGAAIFSADLVRKITVPARLEFIRLSSYRNDRSSGSVTVVGELPSDALHGSSVLIVEDIVDTGVTLDYLKRLLLEKYAVKDIRSCVLLDKPSRREIGVGADYTGRVIDDLFVVGYGLDYNEKYRTLPYIGVLKV